LGAASGPSQSSNEAIGTIDTASTSYPARLTFSKIDERLNASRTNSGAGTSFM
jgi:hypothetical protein